MKKFSANEIKILKTSHLILVMMWVVGVVAMGVIYFARPQSGDELYTYFRIMRLIDDMVVIPGAILTVVTGVIYGMFTNWGFFKHKWIIVKWILGIIIIIVGTFVFSPWLDQCLSLSDTMRDSALSDPYILQYTPLIAISAGVQSIALFFLIGVSVFKPWKKQKK